MDTLSRIRWQNHSFPDPWLPFPARLLGVTFFLAVAVWATAPIALGAGVAGAVLFRFLCVPAGNGLAREMLFPLSATLFWGLLALPTTPLAELCGKLPAIFARLFLAFSPSLAFSRSLNTRELGWNLSRILPPSLLLGIEISLRFIPVLLVELTDVFAIQSARGNFRLAHPAHSLRALIYPFFHRLFRISERVAYGLQTRNIDPHQTPGRVSPQTLRRLISKGFQEESPCPDLSRGLSARFKTNT